jgi:hypothetical protein
MKEILVDLSKGKKPKIGTYEKRLNSAPISGMME